MKLIGIGLMLIVMMASCGKEESRNELRISNNTQKDNVALVKETPRTINIKLEDDELSVYKVYALSRGKREVVARGSSNNGQFYKRIELPKAINEVEIIRSSVSGQVQNTYKLNSDSTLITELK